MNDKFRKIKESLIENIVPFGVISETDDRLDLKIREESDTHTFYENLDGTVSHGVWIDQYYDHQGDVEIDELIRDIKMCW